MISYLKSTLKWFSDHRLNLINTTIAAGVAVAALWQYHYAEEREFRHSYYENQIRVVNEIYDVMHAIDIADSDVDKIRAAKEFWKIWYGDGRTYLTPVMFSRLKAAADYVVTCIDKIKSPRASVFPCSYTPEMTIAGFSYAARQELSTSWKVDFTEIKETDPWLTEPNH